MEGRKTTNIQSIIVLSLGKTMSDLFQTNSKIDFDYLLKEKICMAYLRYLRDHIKIPKTRTTATYRNTWAYHYS
jgi:hypothetical protein